MVVRYIEARLVSFLFHIAEYLVKGFDDGGVGEVLDWDCVDVVRVVIIRHIVILISIDGSDWKRAGGVRVQSAFVLVCKRCEAEHVAD